MDLGDITEATLALVRRNQQLVELALFCLGFAESLIVTSFFVPASVLFLAIGALHGAGGGAFLPILIAGAVGSFLGDVASYSIGRIWKDKVTGIWPFRERPGLVVGARVLFERWGLVGIVLGKFVGPMKPVIPLVGGMLAVPWPQFGIASAVSSLVWALAFLAPAYYGLKWSAGGF